MVEERRAWRNFVRGYAYIVFRTIGYKKKYVKIPHGHIWVEGDHRGHSFDSNAFGPCLTGWIFGLIWHGLS
uniref:Peptidase S26 domain-containing protein n=1 Tax=Varanus komodoensis TaxID=61221 RepID=A0A8D2IZ80_VARKO